jgi:hypothetical protein
VLSAAGWLGAGAATAQIDTGVHDSWIVTNSRIDRYAALYGDAQWVNLEELLSGNVPLTGAIRTRGVLRASPRERGVVRRYALTLPPGRAVAAVNDRFPITPGRDVADNFDFEADSLNLREIEVVGTFQGASGADAVQGAGFWFWAYSAAPERRARPSTTGLLAIEDLVNRAGDLAKEPVRVRGQFRGKNLFGDLAAEGGPPDGWVLKGGGFAVWVVGKRPRGDGWSLDVMSRSDCSRWLEVEGRMEKRGELAWLKAAKVELVAPPRAEEPE